MVCVIQVCWQIDSCQQICMTYTIAVCTVKNTWWWTEELSETCRVSFQNKFWEISESSWFIIRKYATKFLLPVFSTVYNMFRLAWPNSGNTKKKYKLLSQVFCQTGQYVTLLLFGVFLNVTFFMYSESLCCVTAIQMMNDNINLVLYTPLLFH